MNQNTESNNEQIVLIEENFNHQLDELSAQLEPELEVLSKEQSLRLYIDSGLEKSLQELEQFKSEFAALQGESLIDQCFDNAKAAVWGSFGLASAVLGAQDGGNVNTTNNARKGIYASEKERQAYENREKYDKKKSDEYHSDPAYNKIKKSKKDGQVYDYMTDQEISPSNAHLDHIIPAKIIHNDPAIVLAEVDGKALANAKENLAFTDSILNLSKGAKSIPEFLEYKNNELKRLDELAQKGKLTDEDKEWREKLLEIDDKKVLEAYDKSKKDIDAKVDKQYYTSSKPYKEALQTGAIDGAKMAAHHAIGIILHDLIEHIAKWVKETFKKFGGESLKEIFNRFKKEMQVVWAKIKNKWKHILSGSLEAGITAFFSNLIVFVINIFFTTIKSVVRIIRAGFTQIVKAVKILANPPEHIHKDDVMFEAAKVFVAGMISSMTMLGSESIKTWLLATPGFNVILSIPIPFSNETIADTLSLCISATLGAVLSTIAVYHMQNLRDDSKKNKLQIQMVTKSGEIVWFSVAQTWFVVKDGYEYLADSIQASQKTIENAKAQIADDDEFDKEFESMFNQLRQLTK